MHEKDRLPLTNKLGSSADINKRLRRQTAIAREERAKGQALLASIGDGLIATNESGKIAQINQVALDLLKFSKKELLGNWLPGKIVAVYEDGSPVDPMERPTSKVFLTGKTVNDTLFYKIKTGDVIPVQITAAPVFLRNKPIGAIEIFRDISKEMEIDRQKSEFISLASHQLRTPISSINIYTHMLKDGYAGKLTKKQLELLNIVMTSTSRMNNLISTLLNISRAESNNIAVDSNLLNLGKLLNELITSSQPRFVNKKITVKSKIEDKIPLINSDKLIVGEILSNLISNSLKYTPPGGIITVSLRKKGNGILFSITDTGYGIPAESQPFIFTKFFRADNIMSYDVTGIGLGLYISKLLANKINADIWFKSKERNGTSFFFSIPIHGNTPGVGRFKLETISP